MYLVRAPIMPMLSLSGEEGPIIFRPFKMRGQVLSGLQGKTLGTRKRFAAGDVAPSRVFKEDRPQRQMRGVALPSPIQTAAGLRSTFPATQRVALPRLASPCLALVCLALHCLVGLTALP